MGRKPLESDSNNKWVPLILVIFSLLSCSGVYIFMSTLHNNNSPANGSKIGTLSKLEEETDEVSEACCKGVEKLELWGDAVKWGADFKVNSAQECCRACKDICPGNGGRCLCDTWVFCGNKEECGEKFGECWLKKQKDTLAPEKQETGISSIWTSGLIFGVGQGTIGLETDYGTLRIKLLPDCSPHSTFYMLELLKLRHCAGCHFYRAESRGQSWDSQGNHIKDASFGPPFALLQGTLEAQGLEFNKIHSEFCPRIQRGSVAWVESGPEFFISLANHNEWQKTYTVFGNVLPEDMEIADKIAQLPTNSDVWNGVKVSVLEKPVSLKIRRINTSEGKVIEI